MKVPYYSDEEIEQKIEQQKLNLDGALEFILKDATHKYSKQGNSMIEVELLLTAQPDRWPIKDYLMIESTAGLALKKVKRFMQSIGLENLHKAGEFSVADILDKRRLGYFKLKEYEEEYTDKKTGNLMKGKRLKVEEYIPSLDQEDILNPEQHPDFNDDIPF